MEILDRYIDQLLKKAALRHRSGISKKSGRGQNLPGTILMAGMINAILELYHIKKNPAYLEFADAFIDYFVREDGSILSYDPKEYNLDNVNAGKTLFDLYKLTGKAKYRKAMDTVYSQLQGQPRTSTGNFWHKLIYPNQIWLDGLIWHSRSICSMN